MKVCSQNIYKFFKQFSSYQGRPFWGYYIDMKKWIFITTLLFSWMSQAQTYVLNTEINPPFSMRKNQKAAGRPDDPLTGIAVEIVGKLFNRTKVPFKLRVYDWKIAYDNSLKKINQGCFPTTRTPFREKLFQWVGPLVASDWYFIGLKDRDIKYKDLKDPKLKKLKIGTLKGGAIENFLKDYKIPLISEDNSYKSVMQLKNGQIDLLAIEGQQGHYWSKKVGLKAKRVGIIKRHRFLYLAFNKKVSKNLVSVLNKELGKMRRDGTVRKIFRKYQNL